MVILRDAITPTISVPAESLLRSPVLRDPDSVPSASELFLVADQYVEWGWSLFFVGPDKRPVCRWGQCQTHRATTFELGELAVRHAGRIGGLAVAPGHISHRLFVRDYDRIDAYHAGAAALPAVAAIVPTVKTYRGAHIYGLLPVGHPPVYAKLTDGELIADGRHYTVLPPSAHPRGGRYAWAANEPHAASDLPELDPRAVGLLPATAPRTGRHRPATPAAEKTNTACVAFALPPARPSAHPGDLPLEVREKEAALRCVPAGPGERNRCLWDYARQLKALPHLTDATAADLDPLFDFWFELSVSRIRTKSRAANRKQFRAE